MCVVSMIGDYGRLGWSLPPQPTTFPAPFAPPYKGPTREQFEEFLELLRAARKFDKATGQAECPSEEKTGWVKGTAKYLGIDEAKITEIFK